MAIPRPPFGPNPPRRETGGQGWPASLPRRAARHLPSTTNQGVSPASTGTPLDAQAGVQLPAEMSLSVAVSSPAENGDRGCSAAATLGLIGMFHNTPNHQESDGPADRTRTYLESRGWRPHAADGAVAFEQTHLRDFSLRGGLP